MVARQPFLCGPTDGAGTGHAIPAYPEKHFGNLPGLTELPPLEGAKPRLNRSAGRDDLTDDRAARYAGFSGIIVIFAKKNREY